MPKRKSQAQESKAVPAVKGKGKGKATAAKESAPAKGKAQAKQQPATKRARFEGPASPEKQAPAPRQKRTKGQHDGAKAAVAPTPAAPTTFVVSAGSYERLLYGLSCKFVPATSPDSGLPFELEYAPIFSFPAHLSSLRSVAASVQIGRAHV